MPGGAGTLAARRAPCSGTTAPYVQCLKAAASDADRDGLDLTDLLDGLRRKPAGLHALLPRTFHFLKSLGPSGRLCGAGREWLRAAYVRSIAGELVVSRWTDTLTARRTSASIPVMLLKGTAFARYLYPKDAPRPARDIDLLVRERDWPLPAR